MIGPPLHGAVRWHHAVRPARMAESLPVQRQEIICTLLDAGLGDPIVTVAGIVTTDNIINRERDDHGRQRRQVGHGALLVESVLAWVVRRLDAVIV